MGGSEAPTPKILIHLPACARVRPWAPGGGGAFGARRRTKLGFQTQDPENIRGPISPSLQPWMRVCLGLGVPAFGSRIDLQWGVAPLVAVAEARGADLRRQ